MLKLDTVEDLLRLVRDQISESITLRYKSSSSLGRSKSQLDELTKDVSAFANSAGGQIIYGIIERNRKADSLDAGADPSIISREWIEQTIDLGIQPRIEGLAVKQICIETNFAYIIEIPQAVTCAPHQAIDHRYYKRFNSLSVPMEDYELRDVFRRSIVAEPFMDIKFANMTLTTTVKFEHGTDLTAPVPLIMTVGNRSPEPAFYTILEFFLDERLFIKDNGSFIHNGVIQFPNGIKSNRFVQKIGIPSQFPLFKEMSFSASERPFAFQIPNVLMETATQFVIGYHAATPGCSVEQFGFVHTALTSLQLVMQNHVVNRLRY